jgi:hypothetical protein
MADALLSLTSNVAVRPPRLPPLAALDSWGERFACSFSVAMAAHHLT